MTTDINELVKRLRVAEVGEAFQTEDGSPELLPTELGLDAADALETMAGEVERLKEERGAAITDRFDAAADRIKVVAAERDRLKGEVERLKSQRDEYLQFWKNNAEACEAAEAERDRLKAALAVPEVWTEEERDGMAAAWREAGQKHGMYETIFAVATWLLRHRARKALGGDA